MPWGSRARETVMRLFEQGQSEQAIVKEVLREYACDDKTIRRYIAGLQLLRAQDTGAGAEHLKTARDRYDNLNGSEHHLLELGRAYDAFKDKRTGSDIVRQHAELDHVAKLKVCARLLVRQLTLDPPSSVKVWKAPIDPSPTVDMLQLPIETDPLFLYLQGHVPDKDLWESFKGWKRHGFEYLRDCREIIQCIVAECERQSGTRLLNEKEWPQEGIFTTFAERVYVHHTQLAYPGDGSLEVEYSSGQTQPSKVKEQRDVWLLCHGYVGIACHRTKNSLIKWQTLHKNMLGKQAFTTRAQELGTEYLKLMDEAKPITAKLQEEIERGTFNRSSCPLCP